MTPMCRAIHDDPAASFWLKNALRSVLDRDPVDALRDSESLVTALKERLDIIFNEQVTK